MAEILPLEGKYYGTKIKIKNPTCPRDTDEITVWFPDHFAEPFASEREIKQNDWTPAEEHDHVEDAQSYRIAQIIAETLTKEGF
jgi:hypothetical protein